MPITRTGAFIGSYGLQGRGAITFDWVPDPEVFQDRILYVKDALEDRTLPLLAAQTVLQQDIRENFEGEHDPEGQPWADWSPHYEERTMPYMMPPHHGKKLDWRGNLKEAATDDRSFVQVSGHSVNDDSLFYDTNGLPPYWVFHQQPENPNLATQFGTRTFSEGIPQRRFLGMSGEAEIEILEAFDQWFQGILEIAVSSAGRTFIRRRDPKTGRFMAAG